MTELAGAGAGAWVPCCVGRVSGPFWPQPVARQAAASRIAMAKTRNITTRLGRNGPTVYGHRPAPVCMACQRGGVLVVAIGEVAHAGEFTEQVRVAPGGSVMHSLKQTLGFRVRKVCIRRRLCADSGGYQQWQGRAGGQASNTIHHSLPSGGGACGSSPQCSSMRRPALLVGVRNRYPECRRGVRRRRSGSWPECAGQGFMDYGRGRIAINGPRSTRGRAHHR